MADQDFSPLTDQHLTQINNALEVIAVAERQIDMAKRAGIDVSTQEKSLAENKAKLLQVKNVYFPNR